MKTLEENFVDKMSQEKLNGFNKINSTETDRLQIMKEYEQKYYDDLEKTDKKNAICTLCGYIEPDVRAYHPPTEEKEIKEGFLGSGPGEQHIPEDTKTKDRCCPVCYKAVIENGQKKCKQTCLHGTYQDYNCLSEEAYKTLMYDDTELSGDYKKPSKSDKIKEEKEKLELKLNDPMITEEEKVKIEDKIETLNEEIEKLDNSINKWVYLFGVAAAIVTFLVSRKSFDVYTRIMLSVFVGFCFSLVFWFGDKMNNISQETEKEEKDIPPTKSVSKELKELKKDKKKKNDRKKEISESKSESEQDSSQDSSPEQDILQDTEQDYTMNYP